MPTDSSHRRLRGFAALFAAMFALLAVRLVYVHVIAPHAPDAGEDSVNRIARPARRGALLSADDKVLAWSQARINIQVDPVVLGTNQGRIRAVAELLVRELGNTNNKVNVEGLVAQITPRAETRRWSSITTNGFVAQLDARQRPRLDKKTGQPLVRPVLQTNWNENPRFTNRAVVAFTNVTPAEWHRVRTNLLRLKFPEQLELLTSITNHRQARPSMFRRLAAKVGHEAAPVRAWNARQSELNEARKRQRQELSDVRQTAVLGQPVELRTYPLGSLASHVLGYTTNDDRNPRLGVPNPIVGATGVEHMLDEELTGSPGLLVTHAAKGRELVRMRERDVEAQDGLSAQLTIDSRIQSVVEDALDQGVKDITPKALIAIVVRPSTGEILAMANRPTYDPNRLRQAAVDDRWNRAITAPTEPGSTFKICTYATALDLGRLTLDTPINCHHGSWSPGVGKPVKDVEGHGLETVPAAEAFAKSSNVAAAQIGLGLSTNEFIHGMEQLGFLRRSGIFYRRRNGGEGQELDDWGGENAGGIPALMREGHVGTELQGRLSYGYGLYVTPLQTAFAVAALANNGVLMKPLVVRELRTPEGRVVKRFEPTVVRQAVSPQTAQEMLKAMRQVVTAGTGKATALVDYEVGGKTGTAHKQFNGQQSSDKYISTFVGVLPLQQPELVILVLADEPAKRGVGSYFGGKACGPIFTNIAVRTASILALRPSPPPPAPAPAAAEAAGGAKKTAGLRPTPKPSRSSAPTTEVAPGRETASMDLPTPAERASQRTPGAPPEGPKPLRR